MNDHTHDCAELQRATLFVMQKWEERYPNFCTTCVGHGGREARERMHGGSVLSLVATLISCPDCIEEGKCPRCAYHMGEMWEYPEPCDVCGWCWDTQDGDAMPDEHMCSGECLEMLQ